jgi:hypothetical protein
MLAKVTSPWHDLAPGRGTVERTHRIGEGKRHCRSLLPPGVSSKGPPDAGPGDAHGRAPAAAVGGSGFQNQQVYALVELPSGTAPGGVTTGRTRSKKPPRGCAGPLPARAVEAWDRFIGATAKEGGRLFAPPDSFPANCSSGPLGQQLPSLVVGTASPGLCKPGTADPPGTPDAARRSFHPGSFSRDRADKPSIRGKIARRKLLGRRLD